MGANQQMVNALNEAQKLAQKYGNSRDGMIRAVSENGGLPVLEEAMKYVDNPLVVAALNKMGVNVAEIKAMAESLKQTAPTQNLTYSNDNVVDGLQQRLNRLKQ